MQTGKRKVQCCLEYQKIVKIIVAKKKFVNTKKKFKMIIFCKTLFLIQIFSVQTQFKYILIYSIYYSVFPNVSYVSERKCLPTYITSVFHRIKLCVGGHFTKKCGLKYMTNIWIHTVFDYI